MSVETFKSMGIEETMKSVYDYLGADFKNFDLKDWFQFCKANHEFREAGLSYDELRALHFGMEGMKNKNNLRILETGMCFGVSTRYFIVRNLKYGGELYSVEVHLRALFKEAMEKLGLWKEVNFIDGNSMMIPWNKPIDFLFIDSEHALCFPLGEYMKYRLFLSPGSRVGFHDSDLCYGVHRAIQIIQEMDELVLVEDSSHHLAAGMKVFELRAREVNQNRINVEKTKNKKEWRGW